MRAGASDKVVYEAAASCLPVIASNPVFDEFLDSVSARGRGRAGQAAARVPALPAAERTVIGRALREAVVERHSVDSWADKVLAA